MVLRPQNLLGMGLDSKGDGFLNSPRRKSFWKLSND